MSQDERIAGAYRQSELILARYAPLAAAKLVELTESDNQETRRKACLDIISLQDKKQNEQDKKRPSKIEQNASETTDQPDLSPETASRLLAALAEETPSETTRTKDS